MLRCLFIDRLVCFGPFETFATLHLLPMNYFDYFTRVVHVVMNKKGGFSGVINISEYLMGMLNVNYDFPKMGRGGGLGQFTFLCTSPVTVRPRLCELSTKCSL